MRELYLLVCALCSTMLSAAVLDPPSLRCASVGVSGDVTLTWVVPADPGNIFQEYTVYSSTTEAGPYAVVGNVMVYGMNSFTHLGAGADAGPRFYYVTTLSVDPPPNASAPSDTLGTMFLTVAQSTPLGSAVLDWTLLHDPPLPSSNTNVLVQLEHPLGVWSQVDQLVGTTDQFTQVISICEDSLTYRIALQDQLGCVSYSNPTGDVFADVTAPTPPDMVTISVDTATNQAVLDWDPSPEDDTNGYIIFLIDGNNNYIIDTIYGQGNTSYVWASSSAGSGVESYTVAAFDTCYSGNPPAPNTSATKPPHSTIHTVTSYDRCASSTLITWSAYVGWTVQSYELYATFNGGAPYLLGTFPATTFSHLHTDLEPFATYCYVVKAVGATTDQRSLSNLACQVTDYPAVPAWNYLRTVTVAMDDHIVVVDSVDASASVRRYRLERTNNGEPWELVATMPGTTGTTVVFNDLDVITDVRSYTYRVIVEDSCGVDAVISNIGNSILLVAEAGNDGVNRLRWNGYEHWAGMVGGFTVYRSIGDGPFSVIGSTGAAQWEFEDPVNGFSDSNGRFCYYVEATETANPSGIDAVSTSNTACAIQPEGVWIPNAFIAGSAIAENGRFKPVVAFVDVQGYEFIIYNRWGQSIWSTTDVNEAWKGTINGNYVPQGVYAYYVAVYNGAGKKFEERGTVTFLCCP